MLQSMKNFLGYKLSALNGSIGKAHDVLFDDRNMNVKYLVADTGSWLPGRKVLLAPECLGSPDFSEREIPVNLSREQIESSPLLSSDEPVSLQHQKSIIDHYAWTGYSGSVVPMVVELEKEKSQDQDPDPHLRSLRELIGYQICAISEEIGTVSDMILEDDSWTIFYVVADLGSWLAKKQVLFSIDWIGSMSWSENMLFVDVPAKKIEESPEFNPDLPINRRYEEKIYDYYGRPVYWAENSHERISSK